MLDRTDLTIIIVTFNNASFIEHTLNKLYEHLPNITLQVIVVDSASTDATRDIIRNKFPTIKLVQLKNNKGFAYANNLAIKNNASKYVLLLNSDVELVDNSIEKMLVFIKEGGDIGIVGPKLLNRDFSLQYSCRSFHDWSTLLFELIDMQKWFPGVKYFRKYDMSWWAHDSPKEVDYVSGAAFLIKRDVIDKIGLLDERYFMYVEEADFCKRAKNAGYKVIYYPHSVMIHYGGGSSDDVSFKKDLQLVKSRIYYYSKHYNIYWKSYIIILSLLYIFKRYLIKWIKYA
jgi:GT2 family glycosyltransferase